MFVFPFCSYTNCKSLKIQSHKVALNVLMIYVFYTQQKREKKIYWANILQMLSRTKFLYFVAFKFLISTEFFNVVIRSIEFYLCREFFLLQCRCKFPQFQLLLTFSYRNWLKRRIDVKSIELYFVNQWNYDFFSFNVKFYRQHCNNPLVLCISSGSIIIFR